MRKESLKKNSANGVVEDTNVENGAADINGSVADSMDPLVSSALVMVVMFGTIFTKFFFVARC